MTAPRRQTFIPPKSDRSGRRVSWRLWRPLIIIAGAIVVFIVTMWVGNMIGGIR